jgi:hypothetical protein
LSCEFEKRLTIICQKLYPIEKQQIASGRGKVETHRVWGRLFFYAME